MKIIRSTVIRELGLSAVRLFRQAWASGYLLPLASSLTFGMGGIMLLSAVVGQAFFPHGLTRQTRIGHIMVEDTRIGARTSPSIDQLVAWRGRLESFDEIEGFVRKSETLRGEDGARRVEVVWAGPALLALLDLQPRAGHALPEDDPASGEASVLVSPGLALAVFGSELSALGKTLTIDSQPLEVIGILPRELQDRLGSGERVDLMRLLNRRHRGAVEVIAHLRSGVSFSEAQAELDLWVGVQPRPPGQSDEARFRLLGPSDLLPSSTRDLLRLALVGVLLLLLVMGSNVLHLLAAQQDAQRRELAVRWSLGASRATLFWWRWGTVLLPATLAVCAGPLLASWGLTALGRAASTDQTLFARTEISRNAILFALPAVVVFAGALSGALALLRTRHPLLLDLQRDLRSSRPARLSGAIHQAQLTSIVAAATVLAVAASLLIGSNLRLSRLDLGFERDGLLAMQLSLPEWKYRDATARQLFVDALDRELAAQPALANHAYASSAPPESGVFLGEVVLGDHFDPPALSSPIGMSSVTAGYFRTLGQRIVAGREFSADEVRPGAPVIIISEATARLVAADSRTAVGQRIRFGDEWREVVGVVADVHSQGLVESLSGLNAYWPFSHLRPTVSLLIRGDDSAGQTVKSLAARLDPDVLVEWSTMAARWEKSIAASRVLGLLLSILGLLTLALAGLGLYAMMGRQVDRQCGSLAVRMALGATPQDARTWVLRSAMWRCALGIALGLLLSYPFCRLLSEQLFAGEPDDPTARLVAAALSLGAAISGAWVPAARATRIEPSEILKCG